MTKTKKYFVLIVFLFIILASSSAIARPITLTWDPNQEPDISHYVVYWGTASGTYSFNSGNVGLKTEYTVYIPDDGKVYYFVVTAVDKVGLESDFSNEVNTGDKIPHFRSDLGSPGKYIFKKSEVKK